MGEVIVYSVSLCEAGLDSGRLDKVKCLLTTVDIYYKSIFEGYANLKVKICK